MRAIQILGPFNSGTNLLVKLLMNNLSEPVELNLEGHTKIWKHSIDMNELKSVIADKNNLIIIMYRDYYTWIKSTKYNKYDLIFDTIDQKAILNNITYQNTIEVYNTYYNTYINLLAKNKDNVIWVDYYKLLEDNGFDYLNKKLFKRFKISLVSKEHYQEALNKPSKHPSIKLVNNSQEALDKRERTYNKMKTKCKKLNLCPDVNIKNYFR
jgi:hypothetical protein